MQGSAQKQFDFNRAAKIRIIERAQLLMLPLRAQLRAKSLLKVIESHSRDNLSCWLSIETVRIEMGGSESTVHRAIADCEAAGLLLVTRAKRACSTFKLQWSLLIDLSRESMDSDTWSLIRAGFDEVQKRRSRVSDAHSKGVTCGSEMTPLSAPESLLRIPPPQKPSNDTTQQNKTTAFGFEWQAVVVALENEGILAGGQSVLAASANGASAGFVMQLIEHARSRCLNGVRAFGPGALMRRIGRARLGQAVDALWPPPCGAYQRELERAKHRQPTKAETMTASAAVCSNQDPETREQREHIDAKFAECMSKLRRRAGVVA